MVLFGLAKSLCKLESQVLHRFRAHAQSSYSSENNRIESGISAQYSKLFEERFKHFIEGIFLCNGKPSGKMNAGETYQMFLPAAPLECFYEGIFCFYP